MQLIISFCDRRILVQDASPSVFRLFLSFLYCGRLDPSACSSVDTLSELLMLADRYEMDSLKTECESALKANMDSDETVAALLQVADHFNAENLKVRCLIALFSNIRSCKHKITAQRGWIQTLAKPH